MHSSLTRRVFRAIIANEPYCTTISSRRLPRWRSPLLTQPTVRSAPYRSLFGLSSREAARNVLENNSTQSNVQKATDVLIGLVRAQRDQTQLPAVQQVARAFNIVIQSRNPNSASSANTANLSRNDTYLLMEGLKYIKDHTFTEVGDVDPFLSDADLQQGLSALASSSGKEKFRSDSKALAYMLFSELRQRRTTLRETFEAPTILEPLAGTAFITILSSTGGAKEAWDILKNSSKGDAEENWLAVIKGFLNEGLEQDIWKALTDMKVRTGDLSVEGHEVLTKYFARNARPSTTKRIYEQHIAGGDEPSIACQVEMAKFCVRNRELTWGDPILAALRLRLQDPQVWDIILVYSAAQGATPNDIGILVDNLAEIAIRTGSSRPSMSIFNSLIEYAFSVGDARAVQDYINLAEQRGLRPEAKTFLLQLDYEVKTGDLGKAASTYDILSSEDKITDGSDVPVMNRYLSALCFAADPDYGRIMRIADAMLERNEYLDAETLSGLCRVFLQRDELGEALGLLRHRVDSYPRNDRVRISQAFQEFITDKNVADQRAFNAYELFRAAFPETSVNDRLPIMHSFFRRKRPDLACLVFGHMRQREDPAARPTAEAYGQCFEGIATCQDIDGLQMVYNMLKLDLEVEPTTRVRNGLMAAYTACGQPFSAIIDHFWKILTSREGPTMSSFALALRACETWIPQGASEARRIIAGMQSWDLDITKEIYDCYIGAIAGQCEFENTIELIEEMENDIGVPPDAFT